MKGDKHARSQTEETNGQDRKENDEEDDAQVDCARQEAAHHQTDDAPVEDVTAKSTRR